MLATTGRNGATQRLLRAHGFGVAMIAGLVNRGLAILTTERVLARGKVIAVAMVQMTEAGCRALSPED